MPGISVIVAVYNSEKFLERCLDSIKRQTFKDWECILVDDGSTDCSGDVCDRYSEIDSRFLSFHKGNGGVGSARQFGMEHAHGTYIAHVDSDDYIDPEMLQRLFDTAVEKGCDVLITDIMYDRHGKTTYSTLKPSELSSQGVLRDLYTQFGGPVNKFVKRECFTRYEVSFPEGVRAGEDLIAFAMLFSNPLKISYLPEAFYHYDISINQSSTINSRSKEAYFNTETGIFKLMEVTSEENSSLLLRTRMQLCAYIALKCHIYNRKDFRKTFGLLKDVDIIREVDAKLHQRLIVWSSLHFSYILAIWGARFVDYVISHR